jgi:hypothetical protein
MALLVALEEQVIAGLKGLGRGRAEAPVQRAARRLRSSQVQRFTSRLGAGHREHGHVSDKLLHRQKTSPAPYKCAARVSYCVKV